ncbi:MAG: hypothetical protein EHM36_09495, partial [Deltaproteobacteria bacterium]
MTDEKGGVLLDNPPAQTRLGIKNLRGKKLTDLFSSGNAEKALRQGEKVLNMIENDQFLVNYIPISSAEQIHGLVCTFT